MNKNAGLILLGVVLVTGLAVFLMSGKKPESSTPLTGKSAPSQPAGQTAPALPSQGDSLPGTPEHANSDVSPTSPEQAPELEPEIRDALGKILSTSSKGLVEKTTNGVSSVDLKGRFQTAPVATIDKDGNIQITDYTHLPATSGQQ
ncbi:hypothetical protein DFR30_0866 [Thiogranum longum]|uniref:Uncharacterized protein n=1 Tax=Thiogranum longum TaxID=1537524 RepID=A0A4R1HAM1_9GAMM|nr:hypothetical protein [Thiogranum longum]TCK17631.1 hypothetical protein DFR30_0866 [Thiogranum longum]